MEEIRAIARFSIRVEKVHEFKQIMSSCIETVRKKDINTIQYDVFYNETQSKCMVLEHYRISEAAMEHANNVKKFLAPLLELSTVTFEIFGNPSIQLREALITLDVNYYIMEECL